MAVDYAIMDDSWHDQGDTRDLGVLLLPASSVETSFGDVPPVQIAPAGYLDGLKRAKDLNGRLIDIVGYGVTMTQERGTGHPAFDLDGKRRFATSQVSGLTRADLRAIETINGRGTGAGTCFGDSGSPQFDHQTDTVVSVSSTGNRWCNAYSAYYRVDTPAAQEFLGRYVDLP